MENSAIEWTTHTFNPWIGCTKVSDGCKHCYAEQLMDIRYGKVRWGPTGERKRTSHANWLQPMKWNRAAQSASTRARVFCARLADVFEDRAELDDWRIDLFLIIEATPWLDWLLLTKRPDHAAKFLRDYYRRKGTDTVLPNVWLGTSIENQAFADARIPHLLRCPSAVRFLSAEPLLGPVDLGFGGMTGNGPSSRCVVQIGNDTAFGVWPGIDWVIVGGESGPGARPMHPDWTRSIRDQCQAAGVPFLFKQWGEWYPNSQHKLVPCSKSPSINSATEWMRDAQGSPEYYRVGKKAAGRLLDGREWNDMPAQQEPIP